MQPTHFFSTRQPSATRHDLDAGGPAAAGGLSLGDLLLMGIGGVVGTGVFILTGKAAVHAGPAVSLSFLIAGLAACLAGLCYAELAAMFPVAGSAYTYTHATLGRGLAFLMGWDLFLEYGLAAGSVATGWSAYLQGMLHHLFGIGLPQSLCTAPWAADLQGHLHWTGGYGNLPASAILLALTAVLQRGLRLSLRLLRYVVAIKFAVIGLFVVLALPVVRLAHLSPFVPANQGSFGSFGVSGILQAAAMLFMTYAGFDVVSTAASDARRPQRDLPLAMLGSLAAACIIYMGVATVLVGAVPYAELDVADPLSAGLRAAGHPGTRLLVEAGALAGLTAVMTLQLFGQTRILLAMARDGLLPPSLAVLHPQHRTPVRLSWGVGLLAAAVAGLMPLESSGELSAIGTLVAFMGVAVAVLIMRRRAPAQPRPFRMPGGSFLPLLSLGVSATLLAMATPGSLARLALWLGLGLGASLWNTRARCPH